MNFLRKHIKKILLSFGILILLVIIYFICNLWIWVAIFAPIDYYLNDYEKNLVSKISEYSRLAEKQHKKISIPFTDLTQGKYFERVETVGFYDFEWNSRAGLSKKLAAKVDKKLILIDEIFIAILLISKNDVTVLILPKNIAVFSGSPPSCNNFKNCILEFNGNGYINLMN